MGIAILVYRRRTTGPVFMATTRNDKAMYVVLVAAIVAGLVTTLLGAGATGEAHNYRLTVSPWFRSLATLQPDVDAMERADTAFHVHVLIGMLLFATWPFTRLVHAFSAPVGYLFRPYVVYRRRRVADDAPDLARQPSGLGARSAPEPRRTFPPSLRCEVSECRAAGTMSGRTSSSISREGLMAMTCCSCRR